MIPLTKEDGLLWKGKEEAGVLATIDMRSYTHMYMHACTMRPARV